MKETKHEQPWQKMTVKLKENQENVVIMDAEEEMKKEGMLPLHLLRNQVR